MVNDAYPPKIDVQQAVARALAEDLTPLGDLTSAMLPDGITSTSQMVVRGVGALAGRLCGEEAFRQVDPSIEIVWHADDGDSVGPMQKIADITGPLATVLEAERTALNFMGHLSVGHRNPSPAIRPGRRRQNRRLGYAQDDAGASQYGKGRGASGRWSEPSRQLERLAHV